MRAPNYRINFPGGVDFCINVAFPPLSSSVAGSSHIFSVLLPKRLVLLHMPHFPMLRLLLSPPLEDVLSVSACIHSIIMQVHWLLIIGSRHATIGAMAVSSAISAIWSTSRFITLSSASSPRLVRPNLCIGVNFFIGQRWYYNQGGSS